MGIGCLELGFSGRAPTLLRRALRGIHARSLAVLRGTFTTRDAPSLPEGAGRHGIFAAIRQRFEVVLRYSTSGGPRFAGRSPRGLPCAVRVGRAYGRPPPRWPGPRAGSRSGGDPARSGSNFRRLPTRGGRCCSRKGAGCRSAGRLSGNARNEADLPPRALFLQVVAESKTCAASQ